MAELPGGTLTGLPTEREASTSQTGPLGDRSPEVLAAHRALLRAAVAAHAGHEVDPQGDSVCVVCPRATAAGSMGRDGSRGARLRDAGHGGPVRLSQATAAVSEAALSDGLRLRDLGVPRLKGRPRPERVCQRIIPDLPAACPPLQSVEARGCARPGLAPERVLTTVLVIAVAGSTARRGALGDRRWLEGQAPDRARVRQALVYHGGEESLAVFDGAAAIRCGDACARPCRDSGAR